MATLKLKKDPFVDWPFTCTTEQEKRDTKKRAKEFLKFYLIGYADGLQLSNPFYPAVSFQIKNVKFSPGAGRNVFNFTASVQRTSGDGAVFPQPDSTVNPTSPKPPNP